jgi:GNAT superfamily N-acetyltransferase
MGICASRLNSDDLTLIEATQADKVELAAILQQVDYIREYTGFTETCADSAQDHLDHKDLPKDWIKANARLYLIKLRDKTIGYVDFYEGANAADKIWIGFLGIVPAYQKQGIGKRVHDLLEEEFRANGFKRIRINVGSKNIDSLSFSIDMGFKTIAAKFRYDNGFLDLNLEKEI